MREHAKRVNRQAYDLKHPTDEASGNPKNAASRPSAFGWRTPSRRPSSNRRKLARSPHVPQSPSTPAPGAPGRLLVELELAAQNLLVDDQGPAPRWMGPNTERRTYMAASSAGEAAMKTSTPTPSTRPRLKARRKMRLGARVLEVEDDGG